MKQVREARGWSQDDLVRESGFAKGTIHNWETGKTEPKLRDVVYMAAVLGVTLGELAGLDEGRVPPPLERRSPELPQRVEEIARIQAAQTDAINGLREDIGGLREAVAEVGRLIPMLLGRLPGSGG